MKFYALALLAAAVQGIKLQQQTALTMRTMEESLLAPLFQGSTYLGIQLERFPTEAQIQELITALREETKTDDELTLEEFKSIVWDWLKAHHPHSEKLDEHKEPIMKWLTGIFKRVDTDSNGHISA